jgi:hypothetical protein
LDKEIGVNLGPSGVLDMKNTADKLTDWRKRLPKQGRFAKRYLDFNGREHIVPQGDPPILHEAIMTKGNDGRPNGYVLPLTEAMYMTVVLPGTAKGPHLHMRRAGSFLCVHGNAELVIRDPDGEYAHVFIGELFGAGPVDVPPGYACQIRCVGDGLAKLLNVPTPAWSADDPDENPVGKWSPE